MRYLCSCDVQVLRASEFCCLCFQVLVVVCFHVCSLFLLSTLSLCFVLLSSQSLMSPSLFTVPSQCQAYVCFLVCITSCFILFNACLTYVQICFHCLITPIISCVPWCIPSHHLLPHVYLSPWFSSIGDPPLILLYVFSHLSGSVGFQSVCSSLNALCVDIFALAS